LVRGTAIPLRAALSYTTLKNEDDFACGAGLEDFFVGARSLGERQLLFDHRAQRPIFKSGEETGMDFSFFRGVRAQIVKPRAEARRSIKSRGLIVISPRLPMMITRPLVASSFKSVARFTLASISRMMSTPWPPVAFKISS